MRTTILIFTLLVKCFLVSAQGSCVSGDCTNGTGKFEYTNGDTYEGEWSKGKRHGFGLIIFKNTGGYFHGDFQNDVYEGEGALQKNTSDTIYVGTFRGGVLEGAAVAQLPDATKQRQLWMGGKRVAITALTGCIEGDCENGTGTMIYPKTYQLFRRPFDHYVMYVGEWKNGRMHGKGKYFMDKGDIYEGDFSDGDIHGNGTLMYFNGGKQTGIFKQGVCVTGKGTYQWRSIYVDLDPKMTVSSYTGEWKNGKTIASGKMVWGPGFSMYEGEITPFNMFGERGDVEALFNGKGSYTKRSGDQYIGEFKLGVLYGKGEAFLANGDYYTGEFKYTEFNGQGTLYHDDGRITSGKWKEGRLVKPDDKDNSSGTAKEIRQMMQDKRRDQRMEERRAKEAALAEIEAHKCQHCGGTGYVFTKIIETLNDFGRVVKSTYAGERTCPICHGTGKK